MGTRNGGLGNNGVSGDCPNYSIIEIGQNTERCHDDENIWFHTNSNEDVPANTDVGNSQEVK